MQHPLITAKPYPVTRSIPKSSAWPTGNAVGSPLREHLQLLYGPVTTDPYGERLQSLLHPGRTVSGVANLWLGQDAGSRREIDVPSYLSGYVDGEGCFSVSISPRPALHVGWEVRPSLSVSQNGDRSEVLLLLQRYFEYGTIRPDRSDRTVKWEVRNLSVLLGRVIPHFEAYPLLSGKQRDFELFAQICKRMAQGSHLSRSGLQEIVWMAGSMNPSGKRGYEPAGIVQLLGEMKA